MTVENAVSAKSSIYTAPIVAWKVAHSYVASIDMEQIRFEPVTARSAIYDVESVAECIHGYGTPHARPAPYGPCHCGFNAWQTERTALSYLEKSVNSYDTRLKVPLFGPSWPASFVLLRVALYGKVIEGTLSAINVNEYGYRAARQRVLDVFMDKVCGYCYSKSVQLYALKGVKSVTADPFAGRRQLRALCERHVHTLAHRMIHPDVLEARNNIKLHWGYPNPSK